MKEAGDTEPAEGQRNEGGRCSGRISCCFVTHSTQRLVPGPATADGRDNDLIPPTATCHLDPCAHGGGRAEVAFQTLERAGLYSSRLPGQRDVLAAHSLTRAYETTPLPAIHRAQPKPCDLAQRQGHLSGDNCVPNPQKHSQPSLSHALCYFRNRKQYKHS